MAGKKEIVQLVLSGDVTGVVTAMDQGEVRSEAFAARVSGSFAKVKSSFATLGPGLAAAAGGIGLLVQRGSDVEKIAGSFESLTAAAGLTGETLLTTVRDAVKGTVSDMDIMAASNKALLLGLPVTNEQMGTMAESAVALGQAMGQGANKSLDDLITALGRSSPLILDNLGLTVKVGEANEAYAVKLGKSAKELTDAEKKQAFFNAAMDAAKTKTAELGGIQETAAGKALALRNQIQNQTDELVRGTAQWGAWAGMLGAGVTKLGEMAPQIAIVATSMGGLPAVFGAVGGAARVMWASVGGPITLVIAGIVAIGTAIGAMWGSFNDGLRETAGSADELERMRGEWHEMSRAQRKAWGSLKNYIDKSKEGAAVGPIMREIADATGAVGDETEDAAEDVEKLGTAAERAAADSALEATPGHAGRSVPDGG